jgi:hypothetical protein
MTSLIVVALLISLLIVGIALLSRPGGGVYISEKQVSEMRAMDKRTIIKPRGGDPAS